MKPTTWKVYDAQGQFMAECRELEAAAAVVALYGEGATVQHHDAPLARNVGRITVWTEGVDGWAGDSYDGVALLAAARFAAAMEAMSR